MKRIAWAGVLVLCFATVTGAALKLDEAKVQGRGDAGTVEAAKGFQKQIRALVRALEDEGVLVEQADVGVFKPSDKGDTGVNFGITLKGVSSDRFEKFVMDLKGIVKGLKQPDLVVSMSAWILHTRD